MCPPSSDYPSPGTSRVLSSFLITSGSLPSWRAIWNTPSKRQIGLRPFRRGEGKWKSGSGTLLQIASVKRAPVGMFSRWLRKKARPLAKCRLSHLLAQSSPPGVAAQCHVNFSPGSPSWPTITWSSLCLLIFLASALA